VTSHAEWWLWAGVAHLETASRHPDSQAVEELSRRQPAGRLTRPQAQSVERQVPALQAPHDAAGCWLMPCVSLTSMTGCRR